MKPQANSRRSWRQAWQRGQQSALRLMAGGGWSEQLSAPIRHNLRWFWVDGVFAQASEAIVLAYLPLFALAMGATAAEIGLMSALSNLSAALLLLPGAAIAERWGRRKLTCVWAGGGVARGTLALLALLPLALAGRPAAYVAIALAVIRAAFGNLSLPAWTSLTGDIVPMQWRGRYFASRNVAMSIAGMALAYLTGQIIAANSKLTGYQWAMGLAFVIGIISTYSFARLEEPAAPLPAKPAVGSSPRLPVWQSLRAQPAFLAFCAIAALWNFSINIAGPFFNLYLVEDLKASVGFVGVLTVVNGLAALPGQRLSGLLADRWGPRRVQLITGLLIPLVPWGWALSRSPWQLIPVEMLSGFLWAGYSLASFNLLLELSPQGRRARYAALYQIVVTLTLAGGAAVGGLIVARWGYTTTLAVSGAGRLLAALMFVYSLRPTTRSYAQKD